LQSTQGNIDTGWIFNEELRPIRVEELPPNEFFFDKKRKAVVKREFYQEGESTAKKYKVITEGKDKKNEQFTTEIVGTLGAYVSENQFSVGLLKNQLKRKNRLIRILEARLATAIETAKDQASVGIEQARCWQPTHIFLITLKSCLHPLRYLDEIFVALCQWTYDSFSQPLQFDFDSVFTIANVKTPTSLTVLSSSS
jgi:hypothetical protein